MNISDNHAVSCMSATLLQLAVQANQQSDLSEIDVPTQSAEWIFIYFVPESQQWNLSELTG